MSSLVAQKGEPRRVILKCSAKKSQQMKEISAMPKDRTSMAYSSISIAIKGGGARKPQTDITAKHLTKINAGLAKDQLVRTYPANLNTRSSNYYPGKAIKAGAQMVCINFQGKCEDSDDRCVDPIRGQAKSPNCEC